MKVPVIVALVIATLPAGVRSEPLVAVSPGSPSGTVVADSCPTFSWGGTERAEFYELVVYRVPREGDAQPIFVERIPGPAYSWTPPLERCLEPGGSYAWSIRAAGTEKASEWSEPLLFRVVPGPSEEDFQRALRVVERYLGTAGAPEDEPENVSEAAEDPGPRRAAAAPRHVALGGADFSIDSSGNVAGLSFTGDGSGLANVTAVDLVGGACVSEAELDFDPATQTELSGVQTALSDHAALSSAHHAPTVDTTCSGAACDGTLFTNLQWEALEGVPEGLADSVDDVCTVTDNGNGTALLTCGGGPGVKLHRIEAIAVSAGSDHTCGLLAGGSVTCWGDDSYGQSTPPPYSFSQISAGSNHTCGVELDGSVVCWGWDEAGQSTAPSGTFSQVSAGGYHTCGVRSDGSVGCWGRDVYGQSSPPSKSFIQVSAGISHTCGVQSEGSASCWGMDDRGQSSSPSGTFSQISAGGYHTCGVESGGSVVCWGWDEYGQSSPPSGTFSQVSSGSYHSCGVQSDGSVVCWGLFNSQLSPPAGTVSQVSSGESYTCGVWSDGSVACWGNPYYYGQSTVPPMLQ